jgi:TrmH family RNA methyltransferase
MKVITSRQNPTIKELIKLHHQKYRYQQQRFIAEGLRTCTTLMQSRVSLIQLYVIEKMISFARTIAPTEKITLVSDEVLHKISQTETPSGILGVFALPQSPSLQTLSEGIVLTRMTDPGNVGTLIRTAAALAKKTVVLVEGVDPWSFKVVQSSAGTIGLVDIFHISWQTLVSHKKDLKLFGLVVQGGKLIKDIHSKKNVLLVVGSEAHGIPEQWLSDCDELITLPMPGNVESLNAAVAGSIALYTLWESQ